MCDKRTLPRWLLGGLGVAVSVGILGSPSLFPAGAEQAADTIFVGRFVTLDPARPIAAALATRSGRVLAVGEERDMAALVTDATQRIRFTGVALPGLADAHVHAGALGEQLETLDLRGLQKDAILARVAAAITQAPAGEWIQGRGWDQGFWSPPEFPRAADLDQVALSHPVLLTRIDGHSVWVNSAALAKAGIAPDTPDPEGGRIVRSADGLPSGLLVDNAVDLVTRALPAPTRDQRLRRLEAALERYVSWGLTSIHDAGVDLETIQLYKELLSRNKLPIRAYLMANGTGPTATHYLAGRPEIGLGGGHLTIRSFKVYLDGALGSRGAQMLAPYADAPGESGLQLMSDEDLRQLLMAAVAKGYQVNAHAIGDRAVRRALDAFERLGPAARELRCRVEHVSVVADADLPRFAALGVVASMQPIFVGEYSRWALERVGPERLHTVYRTADLLHSGATIAAGSDYPASDSGEAIMTLYSMVTRMGVGASPAGGWLPAQRVTVDEALHAMTWAPAFAAFEEQDLGVLAPGRFSDFTVLSADPRTTPPERLSELSVEMTVVGSEIVYRKP